MSKSKNWDPAVRKREILDCAVEVLNRKMYYKCPVDEIAKYCGIAKGTVYLYFKSKEDLYQAVIFDIIDRLMLVIKGVSNMEMSASKQLALLFNKMNEFLKAHRYLFLSIGEEAGPSKGKVHEQLHKKLKDVTRAVGYIIEKGIKNKEFKNYPPYLAGSILLSVITIFAHRELHEGGCEEGIDPDMVFKILMNGLAK